MEIINNLLSIKIKNRIKLIKNVIQNPIDSQNKLLKTQIKFAQQTLFGKKHNFKYIKTYNDFVQNIPLTNYEKLKSYIQRSQKKEKNILWPGKTKWYAKSSGTTQSKSKFIPITHESLYDGHFKAGRDMLALYLNNNPSSRVLNGKSLMIGGSTSINTFSSYYSGDLSAIIIRNLPIWVQLKRSPSIGTALLEDWEKKNRKNCSRIS